MAELKMRRLEDDAIFPVSQKAWNNIYSSKGEYDLIDEKKSDKPTEKKAGGKE